VLSRLEARDTLACAPDDARIQNNHLTRGPLELCQQPLRQQIGSAYVHIEQSPKGLRIDAADLGPRIFTRGVNENVYATESPTNFADQLLHGGNICKVGQCAAGQSTPRRPTHSGSEFARIASYE